MNSESETKSKREKLKKKKKKMRLLESMTGIGSAIGSLMFIWTMARQFLPDHLEAYFHKYTNKFMSHFYPYIQITFPECSGERLTRNEAYIAIEAYLTSSSLERARRFKAEMDQEKTNLVMSMDENEEVTDEFRGTKLLWSSIKKTPQTPSYSFFPAANEDRRFYRLTFHRNQRNLILGSYLPYVMEQGKSIKIQKRQRKLYTNDSQYDHDYNKLSWSHVPFEHPATFNTFAMDPQKKQELMNDLLSFTKSKEYYLKVGKPWKRGYLLFGPPGTGKSTLIAAMANLLDYDVYDLELTAVKNNTKLRKLLIETTSKSIIVIEDIDCSLNLSGKRKKEEEATEEEKVKAEMKGENKEESKVTLSGLLNFIDGLWSACGGERLIVFTTNYKDKLDPALIRRGRMDMHIELSYCEFEAFKLLAKNYLGIEDHELFAEIEGLMEKNKISPADVAECLMPKSLDRSDNHHVEASLHKLIEALKDCKPNEEDD